MQKPRGNTHLYALSPSFVWFAWFLSSPIVYDGTSPLLFDRFSVRIKTAAPRIFSFDQFGLIPYGERRRWPNVPVRLPFVGHEWELREVLVYVRYTAVTKTQQVYGYVVHIRCVPGKRLIFRIYAEEKNNTHRVGLRIIQHTKKKTNKMKCECAFWMCGHGWFFSLDVVAVGASYLRCSIFEYLFCLLKFNYNEKKGGS